LRRYLLPRRETASRPALGSPLRHRLGAAHGRIANSKEASRCDHFARPQRLCNRRLRILLLRRATSRSNEGWPPAGCSGAELPNQRQALCAHNAAASAATAIVGILCIRRVVIAKGDGAPACAPSPHDAGRVHCHRMVVPCRELPHDDAQRHQITKGPCHSHRVAARRRMLPRRAKAAPSERKDHARLGQRKRAVATRRHLADGVRAHIHPLRRRLVRLA